MEMRIVLVLGAISVCACGKFAEPPAAAPPPNPEVSNVRPSAPDVDRAFLQAMAPHHEMAIEMARMAGQRTNNPAVKSLAEEIVRTQRDEIVKMKVIHQRLFGIELISDMMAHDRLGLTMEESGMMMDTELLEMAANFDATFAEHMTMHHQGAINMARKVLETTTDEGIRELAEAIVRAQTMEIETLKKFR